MPISERDHRAIIVLGGFAILIISYIFLVDPWLSRLEATRASRLNSEILLGRGSLDQRRSAKDRIEQADLMQELAGLIEHYALNVPASARLGDAVTVIRRAAKEQGVNLKSCSPESKTEAAFSVELCKVEARGSWPALLRFVHQLETQPAFTEIRHIEFVHHDGGEAQASLQVARLYQRDDGRKLMSGGEDRTVGQVFKISAVQSLEMTPLFVAAHAGRLASPTGAWKLLACQDHEIREHVTSGVVSAAIVTGGEFLRLRTVGVPLIIVAVLARSIVPPVLVASTAIESPQQLFGKRLIVKRYSSVDAAWRQWYRSQNLDPSRVAVVDTPAASAIGELMAGRGEATVLEAASLPTTLPNGLRILSRIAQCGPDSYLVLVVNQRLISEEPLAVRHLVDGLAAGLDDVLSIDGTKLFNQAMWQIKTPLPNQLSWVWPSPTENHRLLDGSPSPLTSDLENLRKFINQEWGISISEGATTASVATFVSAIPKVFP